MLLLHIDPDSMAKNRSFCQCGARRRLV